MMKNLLFKVNSWNEFKSSIQGLNTKQKGDAFELLTKYYLQLDPKYKSILTDVWLLSEVPASVHEELNLPLPDEGIDLIAKTKEGEYWSIQAKYRSNEEERIPWSELDSFVGLSFGICKNVSFGLICTATDGYAKVVETTDKIGSICGDIWRDLDSDFFTRLHAHIENKPIVLEPFTPRPHQQNAIVNSIDHFITNEESRGKMIMPCGTGKSLAAYWIKDALKAKKIIVAVPSLYLIRQTLNAWLRETEANNIEVDWICVCSDKSVAALKSDEIEFLNQDLAFPALTDVGYITDWLSKKRSGISVVFTTYQSGKVIAKASNAAKYTFDLGIMDEAHKTVGNRDKSFAYLLFDDNIKIDKRCFMTATERRYQGSSSQILDMEDGDVYGDTFYQLSFKQAIEQRPRILTDYKIVTLTITREEIAELISKNFFIKPNKGKWDSEVEAEMMASLAILNISMQELKLKHALSFHSSIAKAASFKQSQTVFNDIVSSSQIVAYHVHGRMKTSVRNKHINKFINSKKSVMTNARCLTEGIDIPDIDCVLFADPKQSTIDIVQATGRALRIKDGKEYGYIILPIIIDEQGGSIDKNAFSTLVTTINALGSNDETIAEYFKAKANNKRTNGKINVIINEKISKYIDIDAFVESIEMQVWSRLAKLHWVPFEEAQEFARSLNIASKTEWIKYCNGEYPDLPKKPEDMPRQFWLVYKKKGFTTMGDFLGSGVVAPQLREYRSYELAKEFVHPLKITSSEGWASYTRGELPDLPPLPDDIPSSPGTYGDAFLGMPDFLGNKRAGGKIQYLDFEDAREFVRTLDLTSTREWHLYCQGKMPKKDTKPLNIPSHPHVIYKDFTTYPDFMGYPPPKNVKIDRSKMLSYDDCKEVVRKLGITTQTMFFKFSKQNQLPADVPKSPQEFYTVTDEWIHWGDFLGTYITSPKERDYLPYEDAKIFVHSLKLKSLSEWKKYCDGEYEDKPPLPENIPKAPGNVYKEWKGTGDWLGTGRLQTQQRVYLSYEDAKIFIHKLQFTSWDEWILYVKGEYPEKPSLPDNIPKAVRRVYGKTGEWIDWPDFLGYERQRAPRKGTKVWEKLYGSKAK